MEEKRFILTKAKYSKFVMLVLIPVLLVFSSLNQSTFAQEEELPTTFIIGTGDFSYKDAIYYEAEFRFPYGIIYNESLDSLLIADVQNHRIRKMDMKSFEVTTLAGTSGEFDRFGFPAGGHTDGDVDKALFNRPRALVVAPNGAIYIADTGNHSIRQIYDGKVYTVAGSGVPGHKDEQGLDAQFWNPSGIVIDSVGNIYISDTLNHVIRKMDQKGNVTTYAGEPGNADILNEPTGLVIDDQDVLYVADSANHQIKRIKDGHITVISGMATEIDEDTGYLLGAYIDGKHSDARFNFPKGIALADNGFLYVADSMNHAIRAISPQGRVFTVAGVGVSGSDWDEKFTVRFDGPTGISYSLGHLFITDYYNNRVVVIPATREYLRPIVDFSKKLATMPVYFDGAELTFPDVQPFILDNRVLVPVRHVANEWGAEVQWDGDRRVVIVTKGDKIVEFEESADGFFIHEGRAMVKIRTLAENLGFYIDWNQEHKALVIETY